MCPGVPVIHGAAFEDLEKEAGSVRSCNEEHYEVDNLSLPGLVVRHLAVEEEEGEFDQRDRDMVYNNLYFSMLDLAVRIYSNHLSIGRIEKSVLTIWVKVRAS